MDNLVKVEGTIAFDVRLNYTQTAKAVASFMLNIGEGDKKVLIPMQAWEANAEAIANAGKDARIKVTRGRLYARSWKKDDGTWGRENGVVVDEFELVSAGGGNMGETYEDDSVPFMY